MGETSKDGKSDKGESKTLGPVTGITNSAKASH